MMICSTCGRQWAQPEGPYCTIDGSLLVAANAALTLAASDQHRVAVTAPPPMPDIAPEEELASGTQVGEYRIERRIGQGGMGVVYGARHPVIGKKAAIKVLNARYSSDREAVERFVLEAQAVNQIGHSNIVDIFAFGALPDGRQYFAMEWLQGETLGERLERGPLPLADTIAILVTLSRALEAAHAAKVIHRDLKADNVFLAEDGDSFRVKLLDFGIAKLSTANSVSRTATGIVVGTPLYMSPEQARGLPLDGRTDVYSLGVLAYAMACGETPFEREASAVEVLHAHIIKDVVPPRARVPDLPVDVERLILDLLAKQPEQRPALGDVRRRLAAVGGSGVITPPPMLASALVTAPPMPASAPTKALPASKAPTGAVLGDADLDPPPRRRSRAPLAFVVLGVVALGVLALVISSVVSSREDGPLNATTSASTPAPAVGAAATAVANEPPSPAPAAATAPEAPTEPPSAAASTGTLELTVKPATARVLVDGSPQALDHGRARIELPPGEHQVTASARGRTITTRTIEIASGVRASLVLQLPVARTSAPPPKVDVDGVANPFQK